MRPSPRQLAVSECYGDVTPIDPLVCDFFLSRIRTVAILGANLVTIVRGTLSALAAVFVGLLGPGLFFAFRGINNSKATGLAAVAGGFLESLFSPWFWLLAISFLLCSSRRVSSAASH